MILFLWLYTNMTGIVYIYKNNTILSYSLMCSTHTTRLKIKIIKNPTTSSPSKKLNPHITSQIAPNLHTIHQNNQNEFDTEFDRTLTYQHKINFLTILNHQFLPKITYSKSQIPLQILTIYEILSKRYLIIYLKIINSIQSHYH